MSRGRLFTVLAGMWLMLFGLGVRLVFLQVVHHDHYIEKSEKRRRRIEYLPARRGRIIDSKNRVLAVDQPRYELCVQLTDLDPTLDLVSRLARSLGQSRKELIKKINLSRAQERRQGSYALISGPVSAKRRDKIARLMSKQRRIFRHAHQMSGLTEDQPVLRWIPGHGVAIAMRVLLTRDRILSRLSEVLLSQEQASQEVREGSSEERLNGAVQEAVREILAEKDVHKRLERWSSGIVLFPALKFSVVLSLEERLFELPGIFIRKKFERHYPFGDCAAHLVGYVGAMQAHSYEKRALKGQVLNVPSWYFKSLKRKNEDTLIPFPPEQLTLGLLDKIGEGSRLHSDTIGRTALERKHDNFLAGLPGIRVIERDYKNHKLGVLSEIPEQHGQDLQITIDVDLQKIGEAALDEALKTKGTPDAGGGLAVMSIHDGRLLALASAPRFDLNEVNNVYNTLLKDPRKPLFNRSTAAMPPGSTYKILSALAFFDARYAKRLPLGTHFQCNGRLLKTARRFKCDGVHGSTGLVRAIQCSCNVFFWRGVSAAGYENTLLWANALEFGKRISDGVPGESRGQIPDKLMKEKRYRLAQQSYANWRQKYESLKATKSNPEEIDRARRYFVRAEDWAKRCAEDRVFSIGNERNAVIGQGSVLATPIQIARLSAYIANGGYVVQPRIRMSSPVKRHYRPINPQLLSTIRQGLRAVVLRGTASRSSIGLRKLDVAGKTGSAERRKGEPNYAWFMGYYPASKPEIAFAMVVDKTAGHGGDVTGPVARKIVEAYAQLRSQR
ncbi:MAG: penicillin-binding transpeptidase domain-containing protein [Planctomycetota bacterium]|nr:penicillin-binding transpeptidase domain-containing protein [Planctomycetota bacterium]